MLYLIGQKVYFVVDTSFFVPFFIERFFVGPVSRRLPAPLLHFDLSDETGDMEGSSARSYCSAIGKLRYLVSKVAQPNLQTETQPRRLLFLEVHRFHAVLQQNAMCRLYD